MPLPDSEAVYPRPAGWARNRERFLYRCPLGHEHKMLRVSDGAVCMTGFFDPCLLPLELVESDD